jgi:hypothetical protein
METTKAKHKVLVVKKEIDTMNWNKSLPVPLVGGAKVVVLDDHAGLMDPENYIKVKHGPGLKTISSFSKNHFLTLSGKEFSKCKD